MKNNKLRLAVLLALGLGLPSAHGKQDIDLFLSTTNVTARPNILFVLDNSANWNASLGDTTKREMEHRALYEVLTNCQFLKNPVKDESGNCTDGEALINVGVMTFSKKQNDGKGGKVISAVQPLDKAHQDRLAQLLYDTGDPSGQMQINGTNNAPYAMLLNEAYRYYKGLQPYSGTQDGDHDPAVISETGTYVSPAAGCSKNYAVLLGNGEPDSGENNEAESTLRALGGVNPDDPEKLEKRFFESNWADEFARFMAATDVNDDRTGHQGISTFVIDVHNHVDPNATDHSSDPGYGQNKFDGARDWLGSIGFLGRGGYFSASNVDDIRKAMEDIINKLVAKNTMFASTTLPVSVNVRGTHLNQVYMGVFRPDEDGRTRWHGNLKMYQLALSNTDNLYLADINGSPVEDQESGFIVSSATSFWTRDSNFWTFRPSGVPESASDMPDGAVVEKGAVAQHLRANYPARTLYTCTSCSSSLQEFDSTSVTAADLGVSDPDDLIAWVKGEDNVLNETNRTEDGDVDTTDVRPWIHGDVLHARPAVINYNRYPNEDGTINDNDIVAFYGANDGIFHAVKGGKGPTPPTGTGTEAGTELWGFIPPEFLDRLNALRENTLQGTDNKQFFMDGPIGVYQNDVNGDGRLIAADGDKVYLYISMRRGGRLLYALDVSDPAAPKMLWKKNETSSGWSELGQTWSMPQVVTIKQVTQDAGGNDVTSLRPILIFGAGYDPDAEDVFPQGTITQGRGIFVVDAVTGDVLWQAGPSPSGATVNKTVADMTYGIPSDVTVLDIDGDRSADRLYVGDTGGNIWRVDMNDPDPVNWVVHKFASLRSADEADAPEGNSHRKFLYAPDVIWNREENYFAILIGSGDREKPGTQAELTVKNRFYMLKDPHVGAAIQSADTFPGTLTEADLYDATDNDIQDGTAEEQSAAQTLLSSADGWYIRLAQGEKVVSNAVSLDGTTVFNTHRPDPDPEQCEQLGLAYVYQINYENAAAVFNNTPGELNKADRASKVPGGGYPPPPVHIVVQLDGKIREGISTGPNVKDGSDIEYGARRRTYWYSDID